MPIPYRPDAPDSQRIRLRLMDGQVDLDRWIGYDFASDFLTPSDGFSFTIGLDEVGLTDKQRGGLKLGERIRLYNDDLPLAEGFIDAIEIAAERGSGRTISVTGRDRLGQTLDAVADPTYQLKDGGTLADLLRHLFAPFGWVSEKQFIIDPTANRDAKSGKRGIKTTKGGKKKGPKPLKSFVLHQTKPYNHESVFHFASRVAQRHGLWISASADGEELIVSKPEFDQEPIFELHRGFDGLGNILSGSVHLELTEQPTILVADGYSGGGEFGKGKIKAYCVNPMLGFDDKGEQVEEVKGLLAKPIMKGAREVFIPRATYSFRATSGRVPFRPMFLHDDESKTQEQLESYVLREMSLLYRRAATCHYVVEGHGQTLDDGFVAWAPDTTVEVKDDAAEFAETMYVLGVHFSKQRGGSGTTTRLDLVRLNSIVF